MFDRLRHGIGSLVRTNAPRMRPTFDDFGKASAGGIGFGVGHLFCVAIGYILCGVGDLSPNTFARSAFYGAAWLVLHFAALVAQGPKDDHDDRDHDGPADGQPALSKAA